MSDPIAAATAGLPLVRRIVRLDHTASTNDEARGLAASGAPDGTVVIALAQNAGRGRLGRHWHSPPGAGLYLSILLRPEEPLDRIGRYALAAAVAAADACRAAGAAEARIKWPNDVTLGGRKVAGILSELRGAPEGAELVLGFGVNVRVPPHGFPDDLRDRATALSGEVAREVGVDEVGIAILRALDHRVGLLRAGSWDEVERAFVRYAPEVEGSPVTLKGGVAGVTCGLDATGALRVAISGEIVLVHAGESLASWGS